MKTKTLTITILAACLAACGPGPRGTLVPPSPPTSPPVTIEVMTAEVSTVLPASPLPPDFTPPPTSPFPTLTPLPPLPGGLSPTELKYRVLAEFPNLFFCDPDFYPIAREDEADLARQHFPELQANREEFETILAHNNLGGLTSFTDEQKLLIYREHKKLNAVQFTRSGNAFEFQLQVSDNEQEGFRVTGLIDGAGLITVQQQTPAIVSCPICLAADTQIDTPLGPLTVTDLRAGMMVWTVDQDGARVAAPILEMVRVAVPSTHQLVHLRLSDGRELWASPGHPTSDGRQLGDLQAGDWLDGGTLTLIERVSYTGAATYDLLPAGDTGHYWADGVLVGSTLSK